MGEGIHPSASGKERLRRDIARPCPCHPIMSTDRLVTVVIWVWQLITEKETEARKGQDAYIFSLDQAPNQYAWAVRTYYISLHHWLIKGLTYPSEL
jgi:hypothetical protein